MPVDELRCGTGRRLPAPNNPLGRVLGSAGERIWEGGETGFVFGPRMLAELARRARSFSALSARKKMSRGDSCLLPSPDSKRCCGVGAASESVAGGEGSRVVWSVSCTEGESKALDKKLGIGSEDGAGDAWNVAPAKAAAAIGFEFVVCGGVVRPCLAGPGDETCLARPLFPFRVLDLP